MLQVYNIIFLKNYTIKVIYLSYLYMNTNIGIYIYECVYVYIYIWEHTYVMLIIEIHFWNNLQKTANYTLT